MDAQDVFVNLPFDLSHAEKENIISKSEELFKKRIDKDIDIAVRENLFLYQVWVFCLDFYFEKNTNLDSDVLKDLWEQGDIFLKKLGLNSDQIISITKDLHDFADTEAALRNGTSLTDISIEKFYFLKSCDVRLQRHLAQFLTSGSWESTIQQIENDVLEEIEDDVDDLEEDKKDVYSGNRLLAGLRKDYSECVAEYSEYISRFKLTHPVITKRLEEKFSSHLIH